MVASAYCSYFANNPSLGVSTSAGLLQQEPRVWDGKS
jgi:hypothetical protein